MQFIEVNAERWILFKQIQIALVYFVFLDYAPQRIAFVFSHRATARRTRQTVRQPC